MPKDGSLRTADGIGLGISFRISQRKKLNLKPLTINRPGDDIRADMPATFYERAEPEIISRPLKFEKNNWSYR